MGDPGCRVNGTDGLTCREDEESQAAHLAYYGAECVRIREEAYSLHKLTPTVGMNPLSTYFGVT